MDNLNQINEVKYLVQENTYRYRRIMQFFYNKYEEAEYWLYKEDVYEGVKETIDNYDMESCERDLEFLLSNYSLTRMQDTHNLETIDDFKFKNFRYQLTDKAVIIERMIHDLDELEVKVYNLEPRLFDKINQFLKELINNYESKNVSDTWLDLIASFKELNENYQDFLKKFYEPRTEELMQNEVFLEYKTDFINYIKSFIDGYIKSISGIRKSLEILDDKKINSIINTLAFYQEMTPMLNADFDVEKYKKLNLAKWTSLKKWFAQSETSEGSRLLEATNKIIEKIYKCVNALNELHGNMINRREEYKEICTLFDKCDNINDANKLFGSLFGIINIKHFSGNTNIKTDALINSYNVEPVVFNIEPINRERKIKNNNSYIVDKSIEKEKILKKIAQLEENRKNKISNLIKKGKIELVDQIKLDEIERRYILELIEKYDGSKTKESQFGLFYTIEKGQGKCIIESPDGLFELDSRIINMEVNI